VINAALRTCMDGFKELYYSIEVESLVVVWEEGERGEEPFARLSDGQRNIIAMIADLAWRASLLNPQFGAEAAAKTPGVVLIDELELHLHPAWQRRIVRDLRAAFPLVQFFGTTHSPQIISEVPRECLLILHEDGTIGGPDGFIEGRDSNAILRDVMGVSERPDAMVVALAELEGLIDADRFDEAKAKIEALRGQLGPQDQDLRIAQMRLNMEGA
jgi:predicted ATP-binding protein involved in virulence